MIDVNKMYNEKRMTAEQALDLIKDNDWSSII